MHRPHFDIDKLQFRAILLFANGVLLVFGGFVMAMLHEANYHPIEAGDPFRILPLWQRALWLALLSAGIEGAILWDGKRRGTGTSR